MKKITFIVISLFIVVGGGWIYIYYHEKQQEKEQYFAKQEQRVEKFLEYNIPTFKTVTFTEEDVSPMGLPYLKGYINNDKKLSFSATVQPNDHNFEGIIGPSDKLFKLFREDGKSYSEIMKEEQSKK